MLRGCAANSQPMKLAYPTTSTRPATRATGSLTRGMLLRRRQEAAQHRVVIGPELVVQAFGCRGPRRRQPEEQVIEAAHVMRVAPVLHCETLRPAPRLNVGILVRAALDGI